MTNIETKTYPSGLRLIVESVPGNRAVAVFFGVNAGSVYEDEHNNGISHVIEHMTFKGTKTRSAEDISTQFECLGASVNAFTSRYNTQYYGKCIKENTEKMVEIFSDMILNSVYDEEELKRELKVIYEEIDMYEDDPGSVAYDKYNEIFFKGTKLEKSVIGTKKVLSKLKRQDLIDYIDKYYVPQNMVVAFAGDVTMAEADAMVKKYFNSAFKTKSKPIDMKKTSEVVIPKQAQIVTKKNIAQTHIVLGYPTDNIYSKNAAGINVLAFILGGGMSSRLFVRIREKLGLVYSINALPEFADIGGNIIISLATNSTNQELALKSIKEEIDNIANNGVTDAELEKAKTFCKSMLVMAAEVSTNKARNNASNILTYGKSITIDERMKEIEKVTKADVNKLAKSIFGRDDMCIAVVSDKPNKNPLKVYFGK